MFEDMPPGKPTLSDKCDARSVWPCVAMLVVWVCQLRYPPLSYPAVGLFLAVALAGGVLLLLLRQARGPVSAWRHLRHPAMLPGLLFTAWAMMRWIGAGAPANGAAEVGTILWAALYFCLTVLVCGSLSGLSSYSTETCNSSPPGTKAGATLFGRGLVFTVTVVGLVCGIYAIWQYHAGYGELYNELLSSMGASKPDRTQAALLHHLQLKRVASFLGDPNIYAAFAALSLAAALDLVQWQGRWRIWLKTLAAACIAVSAVGIYYTGSRGGVLDTALVIVLYGLVLLDNVRRRRRGGGDTSAPGAKARTAIAVFLALVIIGSVSRRASADDSSSAPTGGAGAWTWRSDTVRERLFYLDVGRKMIELRPVIGLGPGSVDDYFGRLKDPAAREARNLHNWPVHVWAEMGAVGLFFLLWLLASLLWRCWRVRGWRDPAIRWPLVVLIMLIFDGLMQTSWFHRELMSLLGMTCGVLVCATATYPIAAPRWRVSMRAAGFAGLALAFLVAELPYLLGQSNKQIARDALQSNDPATALKYSQLATRWVPRDPEPYLMRTALASSSGQPSAALQYILKAIAIDPESAALNSQAAGLYLQLNQLTPAEQHLKRALELYPSSPDYNSQYSYLLEKTGRYGEALTYARRALKFTYLEDEIPAAKAAVLRLENSVKEQGR